MTSSFGHHIIHLLPPPSTATSVAAGTKRQVAATKELCKSVERIHGVLGMAGRMEVAVVPPQCDFFENAPSLIKVRNLVWEVMNLARSIEWVLLTRHPEQISKLLPSDWIGKGYRNVCIGVEVDSGTDIRDKAAALRSVSAYRKLLHVNSSTSPSDLSPSLKDVHWVVLTGNEDDRIRAEELRDVCVAAHVAFLFHRLDRADVEGSDEDASSIHPFGSKVHLHRSTIPEIAARVEQINSISLVASSGVIAQDQPGARWSEADAVAAAALPNPPVAPKAPRAAKTPSAAKTPNDAKAPAETKEPDARHAPAAEIISVDVEVLKEAPKNAPPALEAGTDCVEKETAAIAFARFDGVVRKSMGYFVMAGHALRQIRDRELWRSGGHSSWASYCQTIGGLTKIHANRLIRAAEIAQYLDQAKPIGFTPVAESQVRPLCRLGDSKQQVEVWSRAVGRAGGQPTAKIISDVVAEVMAQDAQPQPAKLDRKQTLSAIIAALRTGLREKAALGHLEELLVELEKTLRLF